MKRSARTLHLYNTLTRTIEPIYPLEHNRLRLYACGPTVYTYAHIGNFRSFLTADLIVRVAQALGWQTVYVCNITDVGHLTVDDYADATGEDKLERALRSEEGRRFPNIWDLARYYTQAFLEDWQALKLLEPDVRPRATEHLRQQILAIDALIQKGYAYETRQGVYFYVPSFPDYGKLSGNRDPEQLAQAVRDIVQDPEKRDPRDFALWKKDEKHLMQWYSPWGWGFPGWHIECSVMSMEYLGPTFDLHLGGEDLIFPHHECEIAQAESLTGQPLARYWVHTRFLLVEGEKMSKSKGNFFTVRELIYPPEAGGQGIDPMALRYALISGKYHEPLNFTHKHLRDSIRIVQRYQEATQRVEAARQSNRPGPDRISDRLSTIYDKTLEALCDDLNTPAALAAALEGVKLILGFGDQLNQASAESARRWLERIDALLGFVYPSERSGAHARRANDPFVETIERLLAERDAARRARDFARADALREQLLQMGVEVMDTPEGTRWRRKMLV